MNLFITVVFFYAWYENLFTWNSHVDLLLIEGIVIIACGMYQSMLDIEYFM